MASNQLHHSIKMMLKQYSKGSFQTQNKREVELLQMSDDLKAKGFILTHVNGLKPKHIESLNNLWKTREYSAGTMKNKNVQLRWWADTIGKSNIMPSNDELGLERRVYISHINKAIEIPDNVSIDPTMKVYLQLQRHLGLRREEAIKLKPYIADKGTFLELQGSWTKGGRPRSVPIATPEAREAVNQAKLLAETKASSLIPSTKSYVQQLNFYKYQLTKLKIRHAHGLRHAYAQDLYKSLTGWECPVRGGLKSKDMTPEQKEIDHEARLQISLCLGHSRISIVAQYCN